MSDDIKRLSLRMPNDLYEQVKDAAANDDRNTHSWILATLRRAAKEASSKQLAKAG